jgi:diguanylate cyclase (GGDEF)-like protein
VSPLFQQSAKGSVVIWYICLVAVINLSLGFALAAFLSRRYQDYVLMTSGKVDFSGDLGVPSTGATEELDEESVDAAGEPSAEAEEGDEIEDVDDTHTGEHEDDLAEQPDATVKSGDSEEAHDGDSAEAEEAEDRRETDTEAEAAEHAVSGDDSGESTEAAEVGEQEFYDEAARTADEQELYDEAPRTAEEQELYDEESSAAESESAPSAGEPETELGAAARGTPEDDDKRGERAGTDASDEAESRRPAGESGAESEVKSAGAPGAPGDEGDGGDGGDEALAGAQRGQADTADENSGVAAAEAQAADQADADTRQSDEDRDAPVDSQSEAKAPVETTGESADESKGAGAAGESEGDEAETSTRAEESAAEDEPAETPLVSATTAGAMSEYRDQTEAYQGRLTDLDARLRNCADAPVAEEVKACLETIQGANQEYLEERLEAKRSFEALCQEMRDFPLEGSQLQAAIDAEAEQIQSTQTAIGKVDFEADLSAECKQVVAETSKLLGANHKVRDCLDEALSEFQRELAEDQQAAEAPERRLIDPLTELPNRAAVRETLNDFWEKDPHRVRQLCVGLLDVDEFTRLNEEHGHGAGDGVLRALGRLISTECQAEHSTARLSGQQFLIMLPDRDSRHATNLIERLRQTIEVSEFDWKKSELHVTVSGAVTEAHADDHSESLFDRLEATLREAKRYGKNRTFLHEGQYPAPVVPPNFSLNNRRIEI